MTVQESAKIQDVEVQKPAPRHTAPASFNAWTKFAFFFVALVLVGGIVSAILLLRKDDEDTEEIIVNGNFFSTPELRSCVCSYQPGANYFPPNKQAKADFSAGWDVTYHGHYKKLVDKVTGKTSYLVLCGTPTPEEAKPTDQVVSIPIQGASVDSSTMFHMFEYIGQRTSLQNYASSFISFTSACLVDLFEQGKLTTGPAQQLNSSIIDVAFVGKSSFQGSFNTTKADGAGVHYFVVDTAGESDLQATLEWVEFVSLFFNREEAASKIVDSITGRYECKLEGVKDIAEKPTVAYFAFGLEFSSNIDENCTNWGNSSAVASFNVPCKDVADENKNKNCLAIGNAGSDLFYFPDGVSQTVESVLEAVKDLDVLIYGGNLMEFPPQCQSKVDEFFNATKAGQNDQVYDIYKTVGPGNWNPPTFEYYPTDYFDGRTAQPDVLFLDLVSIFHPSVLTEPHTKQIIRQRDEDRIVNDASSCVDPSLPLYNAWKETPCGQDSDPVVIPGTRIVQPDDLC